MNPKKKPKFLRYMHEAYRRLGTSWRKPRGKQNKLRVREKGKIKMPSVGYGAPKESKFLHPSGFREVLVHNVDELMNLDKGKEAVKIAHTVGTRKRSEILKKAEELKVKVLNPGVKV
ncbi:MAG: 50S ribosomal protein L32e [Candidatus Aenigmarchaeota archaeon]|nr:50S ribosomal protein L32e [Candidatus Aenigmarchaeota archaeon]